MNSIRKNLAALDEKMQKAAKKSGLEAESIALVGVTKGRSLEEVRQLLDAGVTRLGENKVQEAMSKFGATDLPTDIELHLIGHLQSNKVKQAVELFDVIQSVDSLKLLKCVVVESERQQKRMRVLIQVNVSEDPLKYGISPDQILQFFREAHPLLFSPWLRIEGLMTIVEHTDDLESRRVFFQKMKEIFDDLKKNFPEGHVENVDMKYLSMGMSEDFEIAIEEGATMIRVGRALFEV